MRYTISNQHIHYYQDHGFIEFEEIFSQNLLQDFLKVLPDVADLSSSDTAYKTGRDLWRKNDDIQKVTKTNNLVQIVKNLCKTSFIRLAFDQLYKSDHIFNESGSFEDFFCFQNLECLAMVRLDSHQKVEPSENLHIPSKFSSVVFVDPRRIFDLRPLRKENVLLYFIGYGSNHTLYIHNEKDPNDSFLKQFGYNFGDHLKDEYHPIVS